MACCFTDMVPARSPNRSRGLLRRESVADAAARSAIGPTVPPHWTRPAGTHPWGLDQHHSPVMYRYEVVLLYSGSVNLDVGVTELRAHLSAWLERARGGDEIVVTDRGVPVARLVGLATTPTLERLAAEGKIAPAQAVPRPKASGRRRPRSRRPLADIVREQRR